MDDLGDLGWFLLGGIAFTVGILALSFVFEWLEMRFGGFDG